MKLSVLLLSSILTLGVAAAAQSNVSNTSISVKDTTLVKKKPIKKQKPKTCNNDSTKIADPVKPKRHSEHYCPNCGRG